MNLPEDCARAGERRGRTVQVHADHPTCWRARCSTSTIATSPPDPGDRRCAGRAGPRPDCACVQIDEANVPGNPATARCRRERSIACSTRPGHRAVHSFRQLRGQDDPDRHLAGAAGVPNALRADHLVLELAIVPPPTCGAGDRARNRIGLGVVDIKVTHVETAGGDWGIDFRTRRKLARPVLVHYVHPDCGFWMLKRSVPTARLPRSSEGGICIWGGSTGDDINSHIQPPGTSRRTGAPNERVVLTRAPSTPMVQTISLGMAVGSWDLTMITI